jgi:hypothetical protein
MFAINPLPFSGMSSFCNVAHRLIVGQFSKRMLSSTPALYVKPPKKEWDLSNPEERELYKLYRPERITPHKRGIELLKTPGLNKVSLRTERTL